MKSKTFMTGLFGALLLALIVPVAGTNFASGEVIIDEIERMKANTGVMYDSVVTDELTKVTSKSGSWIEHKKIGNIETMTKEYNVKSLVDGRFDVTLTVSAVDPTGKADKSSIANYIVKVVDEDTFDVEIPFYNIEQQFKKGGVSAQTHITVNPKATGYLPSGPNESIFLTNTINGCWGAIYKVSGLLNSDYSSSINWNADGWYWTSCIVPDNFDDADIYVNAQSKLNQGTTGSWAPTLPLVPDTYTVEADFHY